MHRTNRFVPGVAALALVLVLAACSQAADPSPSTPSATPEPSQSTSPDPSPSDAPSDSPSPGPIEVVEHDLPMIGGLTTDTDVHALPGLDSPLAEGERLSDLERVDVILAAGDRVHVDLGPVYADGLSWYRVAATDGSDVQFAFGWVPGESLTREGDYPAGFPDITAIYGLGSGAAATAQVAAGTPVTVAFAATPMPGDESCEAEVTVIRTDGTAVNVAIEHPTEALAFEIGADTHGSGLQSLFQEEAGQITLQVRSDCAFAASAITPAF